MGKQESLVIETLATHAFEGASYVAQKSMSDKQKLVNAAIIQEQSTAEIIAEHLYQEITDYQASLPNTEEVAMSIVQFNQSTTILVESIGYIGYNLVRFVGKDNSGKPLELIQHISQLNFLLMSNYFASFSPRLSINNGSSSTSSRSFIFIKARNSSDCPKASITKRMIDFANDSGSISTKSKGRISNTSCSNKRKQN